METKDLKELRNLRNEQMEVADKAINEEKPEEAKDAMEEIKKLDERIKKIEEELDIEKEDEGKKEEAPAVKKDEEELKSNTQEGETRMNKEFKPTIKENQESAELRGFMEFLRSKGEKREQVTLVTGEAVIPDDIVTEPIQLPETIADLKSLVNVVNVKNGAGSYPILESAKEKMISVEELAKNPELAAPKFTKVNYEVTTFRGQVPISEESLQDATPDLAKIVAENNAMMSLNTNNDAIATVLKSFTAKGIDGTDGLKDVLNVDIDPAYNSTIVASQSFYNVLDKLKDNNGQYILQQDISSASGKSVLGRQVIVVADDVIGSAAGDMVAFVGDLKQAVLFADRAQASVKFNQHDIYGVILAISQRMDVVKANSKAGVYVTYSAPVEG